jgi:prolyl 4-hydroxylase
MLDFDIRCPFDRDAPKVWSKPGDLDRFFENLIEKSIENKYNPTIFSGPAKYTATADNNEPLTTPAAAVAADAVIDGPWVISLEHVLSDEECDHLIQLGHQRGYERSKGDMNKRKFDGTIESSLTPNRTSANAWCLDECYDDEKVQEMTARIETLTGIPSNNSEYWQLLRYEETQEYKRHHDFIEHQVDRSEGVRILTVFFYLNEVEAGGGTRFPELDLTVQPIKGSGLIWPSVLNENPDAKDRRTDHQALPVEKGIKFGANAWVHQRDFKTPHHQNCQ